jgi:hypothetical protein
MQPKGRFTRTGSQIDLRAEWMVVRPGWTSGNLDGYLHDRSDLELGKIGLVRTTCVESNEVYLGRTVACVADIGVLGRFVAQVRRSEPNTWWAYLFANFAVSGFDIIKNESIDTNFNEVSHPEVPQVVLAGASQE